MSQTVKYLKETADSYTIGGYGVVWGGRDLQGEYFTKDTDFWMDRITSTPPVLYEHGMDNAAKKAVLGAVVEAKADTTGLWIEAQLEKSRDYVEAVMELVKKGVLGWSSGAVSHLVEKTKSGNLTSWPIAEFSLTPDPAEPRTIGVADLSDMADEPTVKSMIDRIKALPDGPTPMSGHDGYGYPNGSYEALTCRLGNAARAELVLRGESAHECWGYVMATFPDYFVYADDGHDYYRVEYSMNADGMPVLGQWQEVEAAYVPKNEPMEMEAAPVAMVAARFADMASTLTERTKGLSQRRAAEGRTLSASNARALAAAKAQAIAALDELDGLMADASAPQVKAAPSDGMIRQRLRIQRTAFELSGLLAS
jgi:HK97 family phage prohead protease